MRSIIFAALLLAATTAHCQPKPSDYASAVALYNQVVTGQRSVESLTPSERESVLLVARIMRSSHGNSRKCEALSDAADEFEHAARELASCASKHDASDDCNSEFDSAQSAHSDYEDAVSEANGDCE